MLAGDARPRHRRTLAITAAHVCPAAAPCAPPSRSSPAGFLAGVSADARSIGKQIVEPRQPRLYPRPPNSLTPENDLPSATLPYLTAEEAEHFKTFGYVVKRGLIPRGTLLPWVDKLWAVVAETPSRFPDGCLRREEPRTWTDVGDRWINWVDRGHGRDLIHLSPNSQWRWHGLGHNPAFVADSSAHPNVLRLVESLLGGPVKRPTRNRGIYSIFPRTAGHPHTVSRSTFDSQVEAGAPPESQLNPHLDMQPFELGGATYFSKVGARSGGFTIWPGSHRAVYAAMEQEFIPTPKSGEDLAATVARIKAQTTPLELVGDVGDCMLYHHCMVHSTGINTSDTIRMSCIQDFTRVKPRRNLMWSIEGGHHTPAGIVSFSDPPGTPIEAGERTCGLLWHHDTIEWGPTQPTNPADMWSNWNLGKQQPCGAIVDEPGWWVRHGLQFPVRSKKLKEIATLGTDKIWRMNDSLSVN